MASRCQRLRGYADSFHFFRWPFLSFSYAGFVATLSALAADTPAMIRRFRHHAAESFISPPDAGFRQDIHSYFAILLFRSLLMMPPCFQDVFARCRHAAAAARLPERLLLMPDILRIFAMSRADFDYHSITLR
jgi:hypothetical protein